MAIDWPQREESHTQVKATLHNCAALWYNQSISSQNFTVSATPQPPSPWASESNARFSDSSSYWMLLPFHWSASCSLKELLSSQQLTVTAARGKLTQLGKENSNQHDCQKKRKQPKDIASLKGVPVKCLWHVGTSAIQRELHVADIFTVISFQQLSCATVIAWTLILA